MSHIRSKSIRRAMRDAGHDPRQSDYEPFKFIDVLLPVPHQIIGQIRLKKTCGRFIYKQLKKEHRHGI